MADTREIVVTIKSQGGAQKTTAGAPGTAESTQTPSQPTSGPNAVSTDASERQQALTTVMVQLGERALKQAINFGLQTADYFIERSFYLKDDYIGQRNYHEAKSIVSGVASDMASVAAWTAFGGIPGLAIGTILTAVERVGGYHKNVDMQNLQIRQMDATLQFNRQRAGYSLSSGSVGENL